MYGDDSMSRLSRQSVLEAARKFFGYVPNVVTEMSHNVATTRAYVALQSVLRRNGILTPTEQELAMLAISSWNRCEYAMATHRMGAKRAGTAQAEIDRISRLETPTDRRLQSLTAASWALMEKEGSLTRDDLATFEEVGIEKAQLYEIIALIAAELIVHYLDRIQKVPLDAAVLSQRIREAPDGDH